MIDYHIRQNNVKCWVYFNGKELVKIEESEASKIMADYKKDILTKWT